MRYFNKLELAENYQPQNLIHLFIMLLSVALKLQIFPGIEYPGSNFILFTNHKICVTNCLIIHNNINFKYTLVLISKNKIILKNRKLNFSEKMERLLNLRTSYSENSFISIIKCKSIVGNRYKT